MNFSFSLAEATSESENLAAVQRPRPRGPQGASSGEPDCLERGPRKQTQTRLAALGWKLPRPRAEREGAAGRRFPSRRQRTARTRLGSRGERGGRRLLPTPPLPALPPPSAQLGLPRSLPSWLAPAAAAARRTGRACAGREVSAVREGKFQVEGRPPAGASSRSPPAASWRSRAARPCTSSSPSRQPR